MVRCRRLGPFGFLSVFLTLGFVAGCSYEQGPLCSGPTGNPANQEEPQVAASGKDWPMLGGSPDRNMVNPHGKNAPTKWQIEGGKKNVKWEAKTGSRAYGGPVVAGGRIFVGTNNGQPRDPNVKGNHGILMCFQEKDGKFLWQNVHKPPIDEQAKADGLCSTPTVEGDRLYYVTPACKVICAKVEDGEIVWSYDMMKKEGVFPCFLCNCSPLIIGETIFLVTGNGTDFEGKLVAPKAPSFIALNKKDGSLKWKSSLPGKDVIEGQWGHPSYAKVNGKDQILFPGGDCYLYGLDPQDGKMIWKFYCDTKADYKAALDRGVPNYLLAPPVIYDTKAYIGIGLYPEHGEPGSRVGHFWCIDISKKGDVSPRNDNLDPNAPVNKDSALVWHYGGKKDPAPKFGRVAVFGRTFAVPAIHDGIVYASEHYGYLHCLDAKTGKVHWVHDFKSGVWGSPLLVDDKIYIGTEDGDIVIFAHGPEKKIIDTIYMEDAVQTTPVFANGTLYIMTKSKLYAIGGN